MQYSNFKYNFVQFSKLTQCNTKQYNTLTVSIQHNTATMEGNTGTMEGDGGGVMGGEGKRGRWAEGAIQAPSRARYGPLQPTAGARQEGGHRQYWYNSIVYIKIQATMGYSTFSNRGGGGGGVQNNVNKSQVWCYTIQYSSLCRTNNYSKYSKATVQYNTIWPTVFIVAVVITIQ